MLPHGGHAGTAGWRCCLLSAGVDPQVEAEDPAVEKHIWNITLTLPSHNSEEYGWRNGHIVLLHTRTNTHR